MNAKEKNYLVKERAEADIKTYGSAKTAIEALKSELNGMEDLWSDYSSDCLGHGITCTQLKISWLERMESKA